MQLTGSGWVTSGRTSCGTAASGSGESRLRPLSPAGLAVRPGMSAVGRDVTPALPLLAGLVHVDTVTILSGSIIRLAFDRDLPPADNDLPLADKDLPAGGLP